MTQHFSHSLRALAVAVTLVTAACGGSAGVSPTAPSGVAPGTGAVITGRVTGTGTAATGPSGFGPARLAATTDPGTIIVTVVGTGTSTPVGPAGDFTLTGVPSGSVQLQFTGRGANAMVTISGVQQNDRIEISVALSGSTAHVESENRRREDTSRVEVNGRVTAVGSNTLQVGTTVVTVPPAALIRHGSQTLLLTDIKVGDHVEIKGTRDASGVTATEIKVESESDDDDIDEHGSGTVSNNSDTKDKPNSGSVTSGKDDDDDDAEDDSDDDDADDRSPNSSELKGAVTSLGTGTCPGISFVIKGVTVTTSAATKFDGISCSAIAVGTSLEVKGTKTGTTMAATKVERD